MEVAINGFRVERIENVTKSGRAVVCGRKFDKNGYELGRSNWSRWEIAPVTDEVRERLRCYAILANATKKANDAMTVLRSRAIDIKEHKLLPNNQLLVAASNFAKAAEIISLNNVDKE